MTGIKTLLMFAICLLSATSLTACAFGAGVAAGAVGTEILHEEGYELDSPIEEEDDNGA